MTDCWSPSDHRRILADTQARLWRYVGKHAQVAESADAVPNLIGLSDAELESLSSIHFLLAEEVKRFLRMTAPRILQSLSKESVSRRKVSRGLLRGAPDIGATVRLRNTRGGDASLWVHRQRSRRFDVPENRLLKHLLAEVVRLAEDVTGQSPGLEQIQDDRRRSWSKGIQALRVRARGHLRNVHLQEVGELHEIDDWTIEKAEQTRGHFYDDLASTARLYRRARDAEPAFIRESLSERYLQPLDWNVLYELYVLARTLEVAEDAGWRLDAASLIGGAGTGATEYRDGDMQLTVHYQRTPSPLAAASQYGPLLDRYGITSAVRRPDIVLEVRDERERRFCIVEVKRSSDRGYVADGAYKLMGYLKDFERGASGANMPKGVLVVWGGVVDDTPSTPAGEISLADRDSLVQTLAEALNSLTAPKAEEGS